MKNMKKILALVLVIVSALAVAAPAFAAKVAVSGTKYITSTNGLAVNVRTGPGTGYSLAAVGTFAVGTKVTLQYKDTATDGKIWYQVVNSSNKGGWVRSDFLTDKSQEQQAWETRYGTRTYSKSSTAYELFKNVQRDLNKYYELNSMTNYAVYPLTINGIFNAATEVAVMEFQQRELRNPADCDGIVGPYTKSVLYSCTH